MVKTPPILFQKVKMEKHEDLIPDHDANASSSPNQPPNQDTKVSQNPPPPGNQFPQDGFQNPFLFQGPSVPQYHVPPGYPGWPGGGLGYPQSDQFYPGYPPHPGFPGYPYYPHPPGTIFPPNMFPQMAPVPVDSSGTVSIKKVKDMMTLMQLVDDATTSSNKEKRQTENQESEPKVEARRKPIHRSTKKTKKKEPATESEEESEEDLSPIKGKAHSKKRVEDNDDSDSGELDKTSSEDEVCKKSKRDRHKVHPPRKSLNLATDPSHLNPLGQSQTLPSTSDQYKVILEYVENSRGIKNSKGKVHVRHVYKFNSAPATTSGQSQNMLLWFKTTKHNISGLASGKNRCVAFYDRVTRAYAIMPHHIRGAFRQILLLCSVSLGKVHKNTKGYDHWKNESGPPTGFDSVFCMGRRTPNWEDNKEDNSVVVPSGKTIGQESTKTPLEYNEYIIFQANKVKVMYAVDVEIKINK